MEGPETATEVPAPREPAPRSRQKVVKEQPPPATFAPVPSTLEKEAAGAAMPAPEDKNEAPKPLSSESRLGEERSMWRDATRMIAVEAPDYVITLHETGLMRITSGEYDCAVVPENGAGKEITAIFKAGAGKATPDQRDDILDLLDRGYRDLFGKQCGPLPEALGKDE